MVVTVHKQTADGEIENSDFVELDGAKNHRNGEATRDERETFPNRSIPAADYNILGICEYAHGHAGNGFLLLRVWCATITQVQVSKLYLRVAKSAVLCKLNKLRERFSTSSSVVLSISSKGCVRVIRIQEGRKTFK